MHSTTNACSCNDFTDKADYFFLVHHRHLSTKSNYWSDFWKWSKINEIKWPEKNYDIAH